MRNTLFTLALAAYSLHLRAQDVDIDIGSDGISIDTEQWYENPVVWVAGVVAVVLIVFLSRRTAK